MPSAWRSAAGPGLGRHPRQGRSFWGPVVVLLILAGVLRFYQLDSQLWLDEISALLRSYRRPLADILTRFPGFIPGPLYDSLAHLGLVTLGESALAIRLPAALFGVAGVIALYVLARRISDPVEAFLAAALLAVSYHHIFFSQNARGYTAELFFAVVAATLILSLLEKVHRGTALAYVVVGSLTAYAQPFGAFVPAGQALAAATVSWIGRRGGRQHEASPLILLVVGGMTLVVITLLYAPFIGDSLRFSLTSGREAAHGPRSLGLVMEALGSLRAALFGWWGVIPAAAVGGLGLLSYTLHQPAVAVVLLAPVILSGAAASLLGVGVHARYFLMALPAAYLFATRGLMLVVRAILERVFRRSGAGAALGQRLVILAVVFIAAAPLTRYYGIPKQDYLGAIGEATSLAGPDGRAVAAVYAGHAIKDYYAPDFPVIESLAELRREEASGRRIVVVTTLERVMASSHPSLMEHLKAHYRRALVLPGTLDDGAMRIYVREPPRP